jgi:hypothetical protein
MKASMRWAALSLIALAGISALRASSMVAASPLSTELCPDGIYIEKAGETVKSWRLLLHGAFMQAEIDNYDSPGSAALISCRYGGESVGIPGSHLAGSYSLSLYREYSHCRFLAAAGARIEQVPDDWGGTKLRCRGARNVCVAVCD